MDLWGFIEFSLSNHVSEFDEHEQKQWYCLSKKLVMANSNREQSNAKICHCQLSPLPSGRRCLDKGIVTPARLDSEDCAVGVLVIGSNPKILWIVPGYSPSSTSQLMVSNDTRCMLCVIYCLVVIYDILELFRNTPNGISADTSHTETRQGSHKNRDNLHHDRHWWLNPSTQNIEYEVKFML